MLHRNEADAAEGMVIPVGQDFGMTPLRAESLAAADAA